MVPKRIIRTGLFLAVVLSVSACAGLFRNYGSSNPSREVTEAFTNYEVNGNFRYYVSGTRLFPSAIMALNRSYRLDPENQALWEEVQMTPEKMKEIIRDMGSYLLAGFLEGYQLLDDRGRPIGVWFSPMEKAPTLVRMQEDGTVRIDTPSWHDSRFEGSPNDP